MTVAVLVIVTALIGAGALVGAVACLSSQRGIIRRAEAETLRS